MTTQEQKNISQLFNLLSDIRNENIQFREQVTMQVNAIAEKVEAKHMPLSMEQEVINEVSKSVRSAISAALSNSYNSPLVKYASNVVTKYQTQIESIFDKVVQEGISTAEFERASKEVLMHKITKTMISGIDGSIDKTINAMKQDTVFRAKLTMAVNQLVEDFVKQSA